MAEIQTLCQQVWNGSVIRKGQYLFFLFLIIKLCSVLLFASLLFALLHSFLDEFYLHWEQNYPKRNSAHTSSFEIGGCHPKRVKNARLKVLIKVYNLKWDICNDTASSVKWIHQIPYTLHWTISNLISLQHSKWNEAE